jgi:hypothetical protein
VRPTKRNYAFPESDLLTSLITIYFAQFAPMMPFLHRPTFMKAFHDNLHLRDDRFGALVLLVCATASRYSDDPRTLLDGGHLHSAGWRWYSQVEPFTCAVLSSPELHDLQVAVVSVSTASVGLRAQADAIAFRDIYPRHAAAPRSLDNGGPRFATGPGSRRPLPTVAQCCPNDRG